ncbi:MAG: MBL fold metallo-hydrolase, partial [Moorea sp. SIO3H5]|nr:MBL fold metallo-hydrolase [Moorena sp. SIO3H5]
MSRYHPDYNDDYLDRLQQQLQSFSPNHLLAREGMVLPVCSRV